MRVLLFVTCLADLVRPGVAEATVRLLRRLGCQVDVPGGQTCCGQPAFSAGFPAEARAVARQLVRALAAGGEGLPVVTPSGSCAAMVRHHLPRLLADDPAWAEAARALAARTFELCQFVVRVLGTTDLGARHAAVAAYHPSCHLTRLLGVREEPLALLRAVRGLELVEADHADECCGFGGAFAVRLPELSAAMADARLAAWRERGVRLVVGADAGCLLHLEGRLRRLGLDLQVLHVAELLDRALAG